MSLKHHFPETESNEAHLFKTARNGAGLTAIVAFVSAITISTADNDTNTITGLLGALSLISGASAVRSHRMMRKETSDLTP